MIALIDEAVVIERILRHLGVPTEIPAPRPARAPPLSTGVASSGAQIIGSWPAFLRPRQIHGHDLGTGPMGDADVGEEDAQSGWQHR